MEREVFFYKANGRKSRADLVNSKTGEIWEVKPLSATFESAIKQLQSYIQGQMMAEVLGVPSIDGKSLKPGGLIAPGIVPDDVYFIIYFYEGEGIIRYAYTKKGEPVPKTSPVTVAEPQVAPVEKRAENYAQSPAPASAGGGSGGGFWGLAFAILGLAAWFFTGGASPIPVF